MTDKKQAPAPQKKLTPDWFVRGVLSRIGDTFDRLTGRDWKPTSSLATSELIERMKRLLDAETRETEGKGRFVPHNIKLKMQWDKFSTDAEEELKRLEYELLAAAIDHINDNRYHTHAPLKIEIKRDYFTEGVKLHASFDEFAQEGEEQEAEIKVTLPQIKVGEFLPPPSPEEIAEEETEEYIAEFTVNDKPRTIELRLRKGERLSVGRTKENVLTIDDASISKHHATLMVNNEGRLLVADTGSTNGTFINNQRIAYGKALALGETDGLKFGSVDIFFRHIPKPTDFVTEQASAQEMEETTGIVETETRQNSLEAGSGNQAAAAAPSRTENFTEERIAAEPEKTPVERQAYKTSQNENRATAQEIKDDSAAAAASNNGDHETNENGAAQTEPGIKFNFGDDR